VTAIPSRISLSLPICHRSRGKNRPPSIAFTLLQAPADVICPIMQEPIVEAAAEGLGWLPATPLFPEPSRAHLNAIELGCGHQFTAVCLVYHWLRSDNLLCPVCRAGPKAARLNTRTLPDAVRLPFCRRVRQERRRDQVQAIQENEDAARHIATITESLPPPPYSQAIVPIHLVLTDGEQLYVELGCRGATSLTADRLEFIAMVPAYVQLLLQDRPRLRVTGTLGASSLITPTTSSRWFAPGEVDATPEFGTCTYTVAYHENRITSIVWSIPSFLFHIYADAHDDVYSHYFRVERVVL
jgi:hypothetical protein